MSTTIFFFKIRISDLVNSKSEFIQTKATILIMLLCGLDWFGGRSEKKNVGEKSRFSWFREFFFSFFGFGIFYFYKIGQELKIVFFNYLLFSVVISLIWCKTYDIL